MKNLKSMMNRCLFLLALVVTVSFELQAQVNRYAVFLADKANSPFSIDNPQAFLTDRAIQRRQRQSISITEEDLPVNPDYIAAIEATGVNVFHRSKWFNMVLVQADQADMSAVLALNEVTTIQLIAPGARLIPNGRPLRSAKTLRTVQTQQQGALENQIQNDQLGVGEMHDRGYFGEGMMIAVFDGGFPGIDQLSFYDHIFTENRMTATYDFVTDTEDVYSGGQHGTAVFSTIAAWDEGNYEGVAPFAHFVLCVTEDESADQEYRIEEYNWLFAAEFADSLGVDVINTSLGYFEFLQSSMNYTPEDMDGQTSVIAQSVNIATTKGILVVVAAGNTDVDWPSVLTPADSPSALTVGSATLEGGPSNGSLSGPTSDDRIKPDVAALGSLTQIVQADGFIRGGSGTSFAAPLISGLAAGVWQANPELSVEELKQAIMRSGDQANNPDNRKGFGIPTFVGAQLVVTSTDDDIPVETIQVYPNPLFGDELNISLDPRLAGQSLEITLVNLGGQELKNYSFPAVQPSSTSIYLPPLAPGIYLLRLNTNNFSHQLRLLKY